MDDTSELKIAGLPDADAFHGIGLLIDASAQSASGTYIRRRGKAGVRRSHLSGTVNIKFWTQAKRLIRSHEIIILDYIILWGSLMRTDQVFGISPDIRPASYVDRLSLDARLKQLIERKQQHVAIRGASKCGKSWLRQKILNEPILIQCRLDKTATDIYIDALSQLGIRLEVESTLDSGFKGTLKAEGELGIKLLGSLNAHARGEYERKKETTDKPVGRDINDLRYIAQIIRESARTLVIEDFHYLAISERKRFAFDLKTLWDSKVFVVIIGVWSIDNMLLSLNPDLSGRIEELSVTWPDEELIKVLEKGGSHLNIKFGEQFKKTMAAASYGSAGILQSLTLKALDELNITEKGFFEKEVVDLEALEAAAMQYAEQLNPLYQEFADRVSSGIRERKNSTGIYAYAIAVILDSADIELTSGLSAQEIYKRAHAKQPRIQLSNLKAVLQKFEELQIDDQGRGLILAYNPATEKISAVDRQLLLYRKYRTLNWPWEDIIKEADQQKTTFGEAEATGS
jgi:hypothetical protein